ncbi:MAG: glycine zipper family protein [Ramlibacter sp.]|jgi:outer membrane lipoprotein SlyB|nr:glycine zipper family protein [Ramlibacter sp.]
MIKKTASLAAVAIAALLAGCASTGPNSPSAQPVLYPNAHYNRVGDVQAKGEVSSCIVKATQAGLTPDEKNNAVARSAGQGAATVGVGTAVGAAVSGHGLGGTVRAGVAGAAIGGSMGAVSGAFQDRPNAVYRQFVQRCLADKGFDVIGWN